MDKVLYLVSRCQAEFVLQYSEVQLFISVLWMGKARCRHSVVLTVTEQNCQIGELTLWVKLWSSARARPDASSQNYLPLFHGMPYLGKNIL